MIINILLNAVKLMIRFGEKLAEQQGEFRWGIDSDCVFGIDVSSIVSYRAVGAHEITHWN